MTKPAPPAAQSDADHARIRGFPFARLGYAIPGYRSHRIAFYNPACHLIVTNPELPRAQVNQAIIEESIHVTMATLRPAQLYPLLNALTTSQDYPDIEVFRDLIEALYVANTPLARSRPVNARHLPQSPYRDLGKRVIALAVNMAANASPRLLPAVARAEALQALVAFLLNTVPAQPNQGCAILDAIERFSVPANWERPQQIFQRFYEQSVQTDNPQNQQLPFSVSRPPEPHRNIVEMMRLLAHIFRTPSTILVATLPATLGILTLGVATFVPIIWLRLRRGKLLVGIEVWDQTQGFIGDQTLAETATVISPTTSAPGCRAECFHRELLQMLSEFEMDYEVPLGRLRLIPWMLNQLPALIQKHLIIPKGESCSCPYCETVLNNAEIKDLAVQNLVELAEKQGDTLYEASKAYSRWLANPCIREIQTVLKLKAPFELMGVFRPQFAPMLVTTESVLPK